jgi:hypothetical protein
VHTEPVTSVRSRWLSLKKDGSTQKNRRPNLGLGISYPTRYGLLLNKGEEDVTQFLGPSLTTDILWILDHSKLALPIGTYYRFGS